MISQRVIEPQTGREKQRKGRTVGFRETQFVVVTHASFIIHLLHCDDDEIR